MLEKVVAIIAKELDKDSKTINADTRLTEDLGADSLDAV
ncbi:MAG: phosphopantetheine-binding protein, partial [Bacilli bacterium]